MPYYVYILQREATGRYYCGQTNNLELRIQQHNDPGYTKTKTTKRFEGPWRLVWFHRSWKPLPFFIEKKACGAYIEDPFSPSVNQ